jgi:hypothetical protein
MAKITGPLMSFEAHGTMGPNLTFRAGAKAANVYRPPNTSKARRGQATPAQQAVRDRYTAALADWRGLPEIERQAWNLTAEDDERLVNGWNLYLAQWTPAPEPPPAGMAWTLFGDPPALLPGTSTPAPAANQATLWLSGI